MLTSVYNIASTPSYVGSMVQGLSMVADGIARVDLRKDTGSAIFSYTADFRLSLPVEERYLRYMQLAVISLPLGI